jgi:hypothetical protein
MVGTHSSGKPNLQNSEFREVTRLMKANIDPSMDLEKVGDFHLDILKVLLPLKDECKKFVRTLEGMEIPRKESKPMGAAE